MLRLARYASVLPRARARRNIPIWVHLHNASSDLVGPAVVCVCVYVLIGVVPQCFSAPLRPASVGPTFAVSADLAPAMAPPPTAPVPSPEPSHHDRQSPKKHGRLASIFSRMRGEVPTRLRQAWRWLKKPHGLSPTSDFRRYVHLGSTLACVWTAFISPLLLAVPIQVEQDNGPRLWQTWAPLVIIISTLSDAVLATESLLSACTAFEVNTSQGAFSHHERSIVKCIRRYARSWAALDLLTALPAALTLFLLLDNDWTKGVWVVQLFLFLKGVGIIRILHKLVRWTDAKRSTSTSSQRKLVFFLLCSVVVFHWAACIFWLISTRSPKDSPPTAPLGARDEARGGGMSTTTSVPIPDSPYAGATVTAEVETQTPQSCMADRRALLEDATLPQQYLCALVWASHIVSLSGGRDHAAWGQWERVVAICGSWLSLFSLGDDQRLFLPLIPPPHPRPSPRTRQRLSAPLAFASTQTHKEKEDRKSYGATR